jgi:lysozyme
MSLETSVEIHEAYREHLYQDSKGLWTFAIGRCVETNPLTSGEWKYLADNGHIAVSITHDGAVWLMESQLQSIRGQCMRMFDFWPALSDARRDVLVEMAYQMSIQRLLGFHDMLEAIRLGQFKRAADAGRDSKWAREDSPKRAEELMTILERGAV